MSKKKFKDTTVGQLLFGAASVINPTLGNVLQGVTSPKEAIEAITKADAPAEDKVKLQQIIYEQQTKEIEAITSRWKADSMSDSWLSKNVRPLVLVWCIIIFSMAGIFYLKENPENYDHILILIWSFYSVTLLILNMVWFIMIGGIILSWIASNNFHPAIVLVRQMADKIFTPFRKVLPPMGGLDFSPILAFILLTFFRDTFYNFAKASGL